MDITKYLKDVGVEKTWPARLLYFIVSALLILQQLLADFSWVGLVAVVVLQLIGFFTIVRAKEERPACGYLHCFCFVDLLCMLGIRGEEMYRWFADTVLEDASDLEKAAETIEEMPWIVGIWILAGILGVMSKPALSLIGKLLVCASVQLLVFREFPWLDGTFFFDGLELRTVIPGPGLYAFWILLIDVLLVLLWHFTVAVGTMYNGGERKGTGMMSLLLFGLLFFTQAAMPRYYLEAAENFWNEGGLESLFSLANVCLGAAVLLVLYAVTAYLAQRRLWCDSLFLLIAAAVLMVCRVLATMWRVPVTLLLLLLFGCWCLHAMKNESQYEKTMFMDPRIAVLLQLAGVMLAASLIVQMRWLVLFVTVLFATLLYSFSFRKPLFTETKTFWILLLTGCTLERLAVETTSANPIDSFGMVLQEQPVVIVMYAAAVLTLLVMPAAGRTPREPYRKRIFLPTCILVSGVCVVLQMLTLL